MKVLVVEDSDILGRALQRGLKAEGFTVDVAPSGEDALVLLAGAEYDAVVLDWMLPGISGLEVLGSLRSGAGGATPVLFLTARSDVADRIRGLDHGADDYLAKPFDFGELVARVRSLCRRGTGQRATTLNVGGLVLDTAARRVTAGGEDVGLTRSEYAIFEALATRRGTVLSKEWLLERLHDAEGSANTNVVEVFLSSLRKKLRATGNDHLVVTRRGQGYIIERAEGEGGLDGASTVR